MGFVLTLFLILNQVGKVCEAIAHRVLPCPHKGVAGDKQGPPDVSPRQKMRQESETNLPHLQAQAVVKKTVLPTRD